MQSEQQQDQALSAPAPDLPGNSARALSSATLFGESRTLVIEHEGERYVLRITRNGKLILTK